MTSRQGIEFDPEGLLGKHPQSPLRIGESVRATRLVTAAGIAGFGSTMDLERLFAVPLTTLDGLHVQGRDIVRERTVLILIDAYRAKPERSAAEIAWVHERLETGVDLVLIWPGRALDQALAMGVLAGARMYIDAHGTYRRLVSPTGKRVAVLADPVTGALETVTAESPVFSLPRGLDGADERGSDRTIDLGDVYR